MIVEISDTAGYCGPRDYLLPNGYTMTPEELEDSEEPVLVILNNDTFVRIHEYQKVTCGGAMLSESSEQWFYTKTDLPPLQGFYAFIRKFPAERKKIIEDRKETGKSFKRLQNFLETLPRQLFEDHETAKEVMELGLEKWIEENHNFI